MAKKQGRVAGRRTGPPPVNPAKAGPETAAVREARAAAVDRIRAGELSWHDVVQLAIDEDHEIVEYNLAATAARRGLGPPPTTQRPSGHRPVGALTLIDVFDAMPDVSDDVARRILAEYEIEPERTVYMIGTAEAMMFDSAVRLVLGRPKPETARRYNEGDA